MIFLIQINSSLAQRMPCVLKAGLRKCKVTDPIPLTSLSTSGKSCALELSVCRAEYVVSNSWNISKLLTDTNSFIALLLIIYYHPPFLGN